MRSISLDLLLTSLLLLLNGCNCSRIGRIDLTTMNKKWAESKNSIQIQICQGNAPERSCCMTEILPGTYKRNQITQFLWNSWNSLNSRKPVLGTCTFAKFDATKLIQLTIFSRRSDLWQGRGVTIYDWNGNTNNWSEMFNCPMRVGVMLGSGTSLFSQITPDHAVVDCQPSEYI